MDQSVYVSGFLYNPKAHRILLLQSAPIGDAKTSWSMLGGENIKGEDTIATFQRIINEFLNLSLKASNIFPVYDYFDKDLGKKSYILYAEVKNPPSFKALKNGSVAWVSFIETLKFLFTAQTKQNVVVGERVINLKWRIAQNLQ